MKDKVKGKRQSAKGKVAELPKSHPPFCGCRVCTPPAVRKALAALLLLPFALCILQSKCHHQQTLGYKEGRALVLRKF